MRDKIPFLLSEAQLTLTLADVNGQPLGGALWLGGFANKLRMGLDFEEVLLRPSGGAVTQAHHVDNSIVLTFGQTWLIPMATMQNFTPIIGQKYVLQLLWVSQPAAIKGTTFWYQRVYSGVTWRSLTLDAPNTNQFLMDQVVRAESFTENGGSLSVTGGGTPIPTTPLAAVGASQPVGFFRESVMIVGEYLMGLYAWATGVTITTVRVIALAPQTAATVLGLEVNGVLTGDTITIPEGPANTPVTNTVTLNRAVAANAVVRWQILSGPDPVDAAYEAALMIEVVQSP